MGNSAVKVESEQGGATLTGLQRYTDEQLAAEMRRRGFEVWKWKELGELGIDYWIW